MTPAISKASVKDRSQMHAPRAPVQQRSRQRFEKILRAAEDVVTDVGVASTTLYMVAERAGMSPSTVYRFFPTRYAIFAALAQRFYEDAVPFFEHYFEGRRIRNWSKIIDLVVDASVKYANTYPLERQIIQGDFTSRETRLAGVQMLDDVGGLLAEQFRLRYIVPKSIPLDELMNCAMNMINAMLVLSLEKHGKITNFYRDQASLAVTAFLKSHVGEGFSRR